MATLTSVFIIDPPERLAPATDTSLALMRESERRGHRVFFTTLDGLQLDNDRVTLKVRPAAFTPTDALFEAGEEHELAGSDCDIVYMRKDPPVDTAYIHATWILERLPPRVLQINPAPALRNQCEKLIPLHLPGLLPPALMTRDAAALDAFLARMNHIVVKPLDDCSGRGVITLQRDDPQRQARLEQATLGGERFVQAQRFLPEIARGDKRVLLLGGEMLGWVRRVPADGDFRSNVNAGGHCEACDLDKSDHAICARIGSWLRQHGIHFAGVDIVGRHVLEVNITSPSCLREMNALSGQRLEQAVVAYAEAQWQSLGSRRA